MRILGLGLGLGAVMLLVGCGDDGVTKPPTGGCQNPGFDCDIALAAPSAGAGLQLKVGPFDVPKGKEVLRCFWRKVDQDLEISKIEVAYNNGSHHVDVYMVDYDMPESDAAGFDCSVPDEWGTWPSEVGKGSFNPMSYPRMLVGFQNDRITWKLPDNTAYKVKKGTQLMIQSHFANAVTQKTPTARLLDFINFHATPTQAANAAETLFDEEEEMVLPPRSSIVNTRYCEFPQEINLIGMFGHFHSRGTRFTVYTWDPDTKTQGQKIYENTDWSDPPWYTTENWGGPIATRAIKMVGEYTNNEDREIVWGYYVDENEHMETYAMYYPSFNVDAGCICHKEGELPETLAHWDGTGVNPCTGEMPAPPP